ncbi:hypothetical protein [Cryptosporangium sp. NPDC048952]|uniref:hypothetical protein n=1 Tax=Cryptosporangium sp. NPDC048952 TaxID=3363961 RepID=UPI00371B9BC3
MHPARIAEPEVWDWRTSLVALRPAAPADNTPLLVEISPTATGGLHLRRADIEPDRWRRSGVPGVLADLEHRIAADPWPFCHIRGYALLHSNGQHLRAADRTGHVLAVDHTPGSPPWAGIAAPTTPLQPAVEALRGLALALNGIEPEARAVRAADAAQLTAQLTARRPEAVDAPAPSLLIADADSLGDARAIATYARAAGVPLDVVTPHALDVRGWQTAPLILLDAAHPSVRDVAARMPVRPGLILLGELLDGDPRHNLTLFDAWRVLGAEEIVAWPRERIWLQLRLEEADRAARAALRNTQP